MSGLGEEKKAFGLGKNVFIAGLVSLFMDISSEMIYPLLPLFLTSVLGATKTTVGIIEGIAEATASFLKVFSGWLSDRFGRKKLLMGLGYGISAASRPLIAGAATWTHVLSARFMDRVGKGVRTAPRDAIIAESTPKERLGLAFGFHRSMDTVGAVIGPGVAFLLLAAFANDLRLVFYASAVPAVISVILIVFFIKERRKTPGAGAPPKLGIADFDGPFRRYILVIAVFSVGNFADAFMVLRAEGLGIESRLIPIVYLLFNVVYALASMPFGALADRIGLKNMVLAGFIFYSILYVLVGAATDSLHMWFLFPLYGIYKAMTEGVQRAYLARLAPAERKATAFGVYHMVSGLMLLPASIIAGYLWDTMGPEETFIFGSIASGAAAIIFVFSGLGGKR